MVASAREDRKYGEKSTDAEASSSYPVAVNMEVTVVW